MFRQFFLVFFVLSGVILATKNATDPEKPKEKNGISSSAKNTLTKIHGICFIFAWFCFVSIACFGARFLKDFLPNCQPLGIKIWFHMHRTLNLFGLGLMICGFVTIFIAHEWLWLGPKVGGNQNTSATAFHTIFGLLSIIVAVIQPLNSLFRCVPQHSRRWTFNWIHRCLGILGWLFAATTIAIACKHFGKHFTNSNAATAVCAAFLAFCGAFFIVGEIFRIRIQQKMQNEIEERSVKNFSKISPTSILVFGFATVSLGVSMVLTIFILGKN